MGFILVGCGNTLSQGDLSSNVNLKRRLATAIAEATPIQRSHRRRATPTENGTNARAFDFHPRDEHPRHCFTAVSRIRSARPGGCAIERRARKLHRNARNVESRDSVTPGNGVWFSLKSPSRDLTIEWERMMDFGAEGVRERVIAAWKRGSQASSLRENGSLGRKLDASGRGAKLTTRHVPWETTLRVSSVGSLFEP